MSCAEGVRLHENSQRYQMQHGFVLITALMMIVILTLLALAGESLTSTQTRIAANSASQQATFQAAEGALSQAQAALLGGLYATGNFYSNAGGLYTYNPSVAPIWNAANFWSPGSAAVTVSTWGALPTGVNAAYIIEKFPPVSGLGTTNLVYRITAEASQASGGAPVMLQSIIEISQ